MLALLILPVISLLSVVSAQSGAYGQCGGLTWTGATTCVSGYVCIYQNPYYSQCLPGSASSTTTTTSTTKTTSTTSTTSKTTSSTSATSTSTRSVNFWFSFGDSYTTTGFDPTGTLPAVGNPLGNPVYPGYTGGGGQNWVDALTTIDNKSTILTYNYAYGGATIDSTLVAPYESTVLSLVDQVNEFLNSAVVNHPSYAAWTSTNALFSVWIGINDIGNTYSRSDFSTFADTLLAQYFAQVQKLYNAGGRNFLFVNVPPIQKSPLMLAQSTSSQTLEATAISTFNSKLSSKISSFKSSNTGVTTWLFDANSAFNTILANPTAYGLNANVAEYGNTGDFWGNNYHPSYIVQTLLGAQIGSLLGSTVW